MLLCKSSLLLVLFGCIDPKHNACLYLKVSAAHFSFLKNYEICYSLSELFCSILWNYSPSKCSYKLKHIDFEVLKHRNKWKVSFVCVFKQAAYHFTCTLQFFKIILLLNILHCAVINWLDLLRTLADHFPRRITIPGFSLAAF